MKQTIAQFLSDETGQDLIEYSLLIAFVVLASAAVFKAAGSSVGGVWNVADSRLATAYNVAAS